MAVLWQGTLEVCQEDISGLSYGEKLGVVINFHNDVLKPRNVFDWDPGIKNVRLKKYPKKCLKQPSKLSKKYLKDSQMVDICKDIETPQEKWDNLANNLTKRSVESKDEVKVKKTGEAYVFHLIPEGDCGSDINCPLVLMKMNGGIGLAFCVDDGTKEITKIKDIFKMFNDKLYSNVKKYLVEHSPVRLPELLFLMQAGIQNLGCPLLLSSESIVRRTRLVPTWDTENVMTKNEEAHVVREDLDVRTDNDGMDDQPMLEHQPMVEEIVYEDGWFDEIVYED